MSGIDLTLRVAHGREAQQAAIDAWLGAARAGPPAAGAIVAEGAWYALDAPPEIPLVRLSAGCVCCIGLVPLRVALTRLVRARRPQRLLLLIGSDAHADRVRAACAGGAFGVSFEERP